MIKNRNILVNILIFGFMMGLINRFISEICYHNVSKEVYEHIFYILIYFEIFIYNFCFLIYSILLKLCKITITVISISCLLTLLDLISIAFSFKVDILDTYSSIIIPISIIFLVSELIIFNKKK
jgi:hypothetical protein